MEQPQATRHVPTPKYPCYLGIDVGLITVKAVVLNGETVLFANYRHHNVDVRAELARLFSDTAESYLGLGVHTAITDFGGLVTASAMGVPFVQGAIAGTESARRPHPEVDIVIRLGEKGAKLTYLHPTPEQHMNGTCTGGTDAFIDQMVTPLKIDASDLSELVVKHMQLYPIVSYCNIFAKSDIQSFINQGAVHEDLAAPISTMVAIQAIAGFACGRPIRGIAMFLGGPLHFLPELRRAYEELLPKAKALVAPKNAQLHAVIDVALLAGRERRRAPASPGPKDRGGDARLVPELVDILTTATIVAESTRMHPLFVTETECKEFRARHARETIPKARTGEARGYY